MAGLFNANINGNKDYFDPTYQKLSAKPLDVNVTQDIDPDNPIDKSVVDSVMRQTNPIDLNRYADAFTNLTETGVSAFTPIAANAIGGVDPSGLSAGARDAASQYQRNAAQNQKIMQWNQQRTNDNALADKIAAAQATSKWQQNAKSVGAEGGASVVADMNEAVTPDIMAMKNYQKQSMDTASQNLAEINKNKINAIDSSTGANVEDYKHAYDTVDNTRAENITLASSAKKNSKEKESDVKTDETSKESNAKTDKTSEDAKDAKDLPSDSVDTDGDEIVATSSKQSDAVDKATAKAAAETRRNTHGEERANEYDDRVKGPTYPAKGVLLKTDLNNGIRNDEQYNLGRFATSVVDPWDIQRLEKM